MIELEKVVELLPAEQKFFDLIQGDSFPWFYQKSTYNLSMHCHVLMRRGDSSSGCRGLINSDYYPVAESIFHRICQENGIKATDVYRMAINSTTAESVQRGELHVDGPFNHRVFIMYLNKFSGGPTYIYLNNEQEPTIIEAAPNKVVIFDGELHAQGFCKPGERRLVFVVNFNARDE